ncbi:MAG: 2-amino-4-hydroxy-6-hydroxymethyldihydropteridine diphosphokinase [Chloroflexi bacterium]|nr:MAG: 2-amino-4-hydroxy-6-hydroxymethyldihydropteridine diphosphokinase [Chloroflexota bacterium]
MKVSKAVVAFGSNIEPERFLPAAVRELARRVRLLAVSPVYQTPPVGAPGTPPFLNGALLLETSLSPRDLRQQVLRPIEAALGRVRGEDPNAPRTIDLDLVLYEGWVCAEPDLELPAPDVLRYAHVALPLADLVPHWVHPVTGETMAQIGARFAAVGTAFRQRDDVTSVLQALVEGAEPTDR